MQPGLFVHTDAGIANANSNVLANGHAAGGSEDRTQDVFGFDEQLSATGHGVARVDHDVKDDLLEMSLVDHHGPAGAKVGNQFNVFADEARQNSGQLHQRLTGLEGHGPDDFFTAEGEQLAREAAGALGSVNDLGAIAAHVVVVFQF